VALGFIVALLPSKEATMNMDADYATALGADMEALSRVAQNGQCPFCGENGWHTTADGGRSIVQTVPTEPGQGFSALTLICNTCGFVRLHATETLGIGAFTDEVPGRA
jgi:hypothetical protein